MNFIKNLKTWMKFTGIIIFSVLICLLMIYLRSTRLYKVFGLYQLIGLLPHVALSIAIPYALLLIGYVLFRNCNTRYFYALLFIYSLIYISVSILMNINFDIFDGIGVMLGIFLDMLLFEICWVKPNTIKLNKKDVSFDNKAVQ